MSPFPLLSFVITLLLAAAVCAHGNEPVKDSDGNELRIGEQYFIQPVNTNINGGLITAAIINTTQCLVLNYRSANRHGVPVSFEYPPALIPPPASPFVLTNAYITIEFLAESNACKALPKFWQVVELPPTDQDIKAGIYIGGNPWEQNSRFMIEKFGEEVETNIYKLTTPTETVRGLPGYMDGVPDPVAFGLAITSDKYSIMLFKFIKVKDPSTTVTSTSGIEKLGLRMFHSTNQDHYM